MALKLPDPILTYFRGRMSDGRPEGMVHLSEAEVQALKIQPKYRGNHGAVGRTWLWKHDKCGLHVEHVRNEGDRPVLRLSRISVIEHRKPKRTSPRQLAQAEGQRR